jgi:hypothetical protein
MSRCLSIRRICCGALVLAVGGLCVCSAQQSGRHRGRPIEFSTSSSDEVTTNLHQLTSKKDGLKQLEEDLYSPLQSFTPRSSLEGVSVPPPRAPAPSAIQSKRIKELLDRRKNWVFMTPEDLLSAPTAEQVLKKPEYGPDGQEKKDPRPLEAYYDRLTTKHSAKPKPRQPTDDDLFSIVKKPNSPDPFAKEMDLPKGVKESAQELKSFFEPGEDKPLFSEEAKPSSPSDPFRIGVRQPSQEQMQEHKKYMDQYQALLDLHTHPAVAPSSTMPTPAFADLSRPFAKSATESPALASTMPRSALEMQADVVNPRLGPAALPDINSRALGEPRSAIPKVDTRRATPAAPDFTAPRRSF